MSERLRAAGWTVRTQDVSFPFYSERSASLTLGGRRLRRGDDFRVIAYSGSGSGVGPGARRRQRL